MPEFKQLTPDQRMQLGRAISDARPDAVGFLLVYLHRESEWFRNELMTAFPSWLSEESMADIRKMIAEDILRKPISSGRMVVRLNTDGTNDVLSFDRGAPPSPGKAP